MLTMSKVLSCSGLSANLPCHAAEAASVGKRSLPVGDVRRPHEEPQEEDKQTGNG